MEVKRDLMNEDDFEAASRNRERVKSPPPGEGEETDVLKEIKAIRAEAKGKLGYRLPKRVVAIIEDDMGNSSEDFDGDPEGYTEFIEDYRNVTRKYVEVLKEAQHSIKSNDGKPTQPKDRREKNLERRFYLVDFVADRERCFKRPYFNWKQVTEDWNKANPRDRLALPGLKAEYYRAIKEEPSLNVQRLVTHLWKVARYYNQRYQVEGVSVTLDKDFNEFSRFTLFCLEDSEEIWTSNKFPSETIRGLCDTLDSTGKPRGLGLNPFE